MWGWHGWWWFVVMPLCMLLFWGVLVWVVVTFVRANRPSELPRPPKDARRIPTILCGDHFSGTAAAPARLQGYVIQPLRNTAHDRRSAPLYHLDAAFANSKAKLTMAEPRLRRPARGEDSVGSRTPASARRILRRRDFRRPTDRRGRHDRAAPLPAADPTRLDQRRPGPLPQRRWRVRLRVSSSRCSDPRKSAQLMPAYRSRSQAWTAQSRAPRATASSTAQRNAALAPADPSTPTTTSPSSETGAPSGTTAIGVVVWSAHC